MTCAAVMKRAELQVVRVDYPLPNTGLKYKDSDPKGDKWWERQHGKSSPPDKVVILGAQPTKAAPPPDEKAGSSSGSLSKGSGKAPVQPVKPAPKVKPPPNLSLARCILPCQQASAPHHWTVCHVHALPRYLPSCHGEKALQQST